VPGERPCQYPVLDVSIPPNQNFGRIVMADAHHVLLDSLAFDQMSRYMMRSSCSPPSSHFDIKVDQELSGYNHCLSMTS
jgi:hypothetical protein